MNIAICDDEEIFRTEVSKAVNAYFGKLDCNCIEFEDGKQLLEAMKKEPDTGDDVFDAIFLDIEMPDINGMQAATELRKKGSNVPIIFLTSHTELAMDGYEVAAFRFLPKPIKAEQISKTLKSLQDSLSKKKRIVIRCDGEDEIIDISDIVYIEAQNNSIRIVCVAKEYVTRMKLSEILERLNELSEDFVQIHRGYVVHLRHVKKHRPGEVTMADNVVLPMSRKQTENFKSRLFNYVRESAR